MEDLIGYVVLYGSIAGATQQLWKFFVVAADLRKRRPHTG